MRILAATFGLLCIVNTHAAATEAIDAFAKTIAKPLLFARYMEGACSPTAVNGWDGFDTERCTYTVTDSKNGAKKTGLVILLDPTPRTLSTWIINACAAVRPAEKSEACAKRLFHRILDQSGGQFPISGIVYEDLIPADGVQEAYGFVNGVTTILKGVQHRRTEPFSDAELQAVLSAEPVKTASDSAYARIVGVSRAEYAARFPAVDVTALKWLAVVREEHQKAMKSDRNALIEAWLAAHAP